MTVRRKTLLVGTLVTGMGLLLAPSLYAEPAPSAPEPAAQRESGDQPDGERDEKDEKKGCDRDRTEVLVATYLWVPGQHGTLGIRRVRVPVDVSVGDAFDVLINNLDYGATLHLELRNGRWGLLGDLMVVNLDFSRATPPGQVSLDISQLIGELGVTYLIVDGACGKKGTGGTTLEALAGARITELEADFAGPRGRGASGDRSWVTPFVGLRLRSPVTRSLAIWLRGDAGGWGGDENTTNFAWNVIGGVDLSLGRHWSLLAGYRVLDYNYDIQGGAAPFVYDISLRGPFSAVGYRF